MSVVSGICCVLLVLLWVRSYWRLDILNVAIGASGHVSATSYLGRLQLAAAEIQMSTGLQSQQQDAPPYLRSVLEFWQADVHHEAAVLIVNHFVVLDLGSKADYF